jgi:hypothetical protein
VHHIQDLQHRQERQEQRVQQVQRELKVVRVIQVQKELMGHKGLMGFKVHQELMVHKGHKGQQVHQARQIIDLRKTSNQLLIQLKKYQRLEELDILGKKVYLHLKKIKEMKILVLLLKN